MIATQLYLVVSGNYAWLNWVTIVVAARRSRMRRPVGPARRPGPRRGCLPPRRRAGSTWRVVGLAILVARPELLAGAEHGQPAPGDERVVRPVPPREHVRRVRDRRRDAASRSSSRAPPATPTRRRRLARVRVQGQARRPAPAAAAGRAVPPAARLADVVPAALAALRRRAGSCRSSAGSSRATARRCDSCAATRSRTGRRATSAPGSSATASRSWRELRATGAWWDRTPAGDFVGPLRLADGPDSESP